MQYMPSTLSGDATATERTPSEAEAISKLLANLREEASLLVNRLGGLSTRMFGPKPQEVADSGETSRGASGFLPVLDTDLRSLGGTLAQANQWLTEIERGI